MLATMNVGRRVTLAFAAVLLIVALAAVLTMWRLTQTRALVAGTGRYYQLLSAAQALSEDTAAVASLMDAMTLTNDDAGADKVKKLVASTQVQDEASWASVQALLVGADRGQRLQALGERRAARASALAQGLKYLDNGQFYQARQTYAQGLQPLTKAFHADLQALSTAQIEYAQSELRATAARLGDCIVILAAGLGLGGVGTLAIGRWTRRNVTMPLARATEVAEWVATGRLDQNVEPHGCLEAQRLLLACKTMQERLQTFVGAQREVARRHAEGFVSTQIPAASFDGVFAEVAREVNALVAAHVATTMRLVEVAGRYAIGDLSADMEVLPNEQAVLTQTMQRAKASLSALNAEIGALIGAARRGELSMRGDVTRFEYGFREMIEGVNQTLDAVVAPIAEISRLLAAMAEGDLSCSMGGEHQGSFGRLRDDGNATVAALRALVGQIRAASESIGSVSAQIATGNGDLAARTEQQAASLEQTASSVAQLATTVARSTEHAQAADRSAAAALAAARKGGQAVDAAEATMRAIHASSQQIAEIVALIDGIAFQTNILALNAAVEAARAGAEGRGFAVVAADVRMLALRSAEAAREIKALIANAAKKIDEGNVQVREAGAVMAEMLGSAETVAGLMRQITTASREQRAGIEQIDHAVNHLEGVTQHNVALVQEIRASAGALQQQAAGLIGAARQFKLGNSAATRTGGRRSAQAARA